MWKWKLLILAVFACASMVQAQEDSLDADRLAKMVSLSEVVIRSDLDVAKFLQRVKEDSTFYKAFRSLHLVGFTSLNDIRLMDKRGNLKASLQSRTRQKRSGRCRTMEVLEERTTGDFYDPSRNYNYYTAQLYAGLFFTRDSICGENNIVRGIEFNTRSKKGLDKHKEQLKMLFFNPGKKIPGIPFIGDKIDIFDPDRAALYGFFLDKGEHDGESCYIFSIKAREGLRGGKKDRIVIDNMVTWFHAKTMEILARNYELSYDAGVYDFAVQMEVELTRFGGYLVPRTLRYKGDWNVLFKKRERAIFTATLFDFNIP
jgi:hypothetical protein